MNKIAKTKVLIIDDNYSILEYLKTVFSRYNFDIKTSLNGVEGLQEVAEFKPDIILLDLMMPNIDGLQLLQIKKVLSDIKDIPVIVISANAGRNNVLAAIEAGADRVLAKPINIKQLKSSVDELLSGSFFESERDDKELQARLVKETKNKIFKDKFFEYRDIIIDGIKKRDPKSTKEIALLLQEYAEESANREGMLVLKEIEEQTYSRPSDWMFSEMKVKELEQYLKNLEKEF